MNNYLISQWPQFGCISLIIINCAHILFHINVRMEYFGHDYAIVLVVQKYIQLFVEKELYGTYEQYIPHAG